MSGDFEIVVTRDGARAMRDLKSGELMHPVGPLTESQALYVVPARLQARLLDGPLVVFDVGLGAGSNAAAAWRCSEARSSGGRLELVSFDRTGEALALALRQRPAAFGFDEGAVAAATELLRAGQHVTERTTWRLILGELPETLPAAGSRADVVFWDPYSPKTNPALWGYEAFLALRTVCSPRATVHTYGAATSTRAAMLLAGFAVGRGPAIGTKGETTVAAMDVRDLEAPLDERWYERFLRSSAPLPDDAPPSAREVMAERFEDSGRVDPAPE